jgi:hypothetical protein
LTQSPAEPSSKHSSWYLHSVTPRTLRIHTNLNGGTRQSCKHSRRTRLKEDCCDFLYGRDASHGLSSCLLEKKLKLVHENWARLQRRLRGRYMMSISPRRPVA